MFFNSYFIFLVCVGYREVDLRRISMKVIYGVGGREGIMVVNVDDWFFFVKYSCNFFNKMILVFYFNNFFCIYMYGFCFEGGWGNDLLVVDLNVLFNCYEFFILFFILI